MRDLVPVNQPEVSPPRPSQPQSNDFNRLKHVDYFAHSVKWEAGMWSQDESIECACALLHLSFSFHCNYTVVFHRER
jgi:hypothetical protein